MTGKPKEDGDLLLNKESGDTINDPKQCADQFEKAFYTKAERLRIQSGPKIYVLLLHAGQLRALVKYTSRLEWNNQAVIVRT